MRWPHEAPFAVSITVDVDGELGLPDGGAGYEKRLTARSERRYGLVRGLPRILAVLGRAGVTASFYVPGAVADADPDAIAGVADCGHEVGHHGHWHLPPSSLSPEAQAEELASGLDALRTLPDCTPTGYRAPAWELTPETLAQLAELGFTHDSSLMEDDRPYRVASHEDQIWELPVDWALDDAPHFAHGGSAEALLACWRSALGSARSEGRQLTFTLHPEILGRPHRVDVLARLVDEAQSQGAWIASHREVVAHLDVHAA